MRYIIRDSESAFQDAPLILASDFALSRPESSVRPHMVSTMRQISREFTDSRSLDPTFVYCGAMSYRPL